MCIPKYNRLLKPAILSSILTISLHAIFSSRNFGNAPKGLKCNEFSLISINSSSVKYIKS